MNLVRVSLHSVAHSRSGDKGNRSNISLIPYKKEIFPWLKDQITEDAVLTIFRHKGATSVTRYELPRLCALNFVIDNALEGGVNDGLCLDGHGKTLSFLLLGELEIEIPEAFAG